MWQFLWKFCLHAVMQWLVHDTMDRFGGTGLAHAHLFHALAKELPSFDQRGMVYTNGRRCDPRIRVSRIEETLATPGYSIDSLRALQERYPTHEFRFVVGAGIFVSNRPMEAVAEIKTCFQPVLWSSRVLAH